MASRGAQVESALAGYLDESGNPLQSGKVYTYEAGTLTTKATYQDVNKTTPHANPIILDDQGQKLIFADGLYKFVIKDQNDNTVDTRDNLQYFFTSETITTASDISAADSTGITFKDDGGNTGITLKDGGNIGIKLDTNPQTALGVADTDTTAYATTINVTSVASDIVRVRNVNASAAWAGIQFEVGSGNVGMTRLITRKDSSDETSFFIQLKDGASASVTTQQLALSSEGDLTIGNSVVVGNSTLSSGLLASAGVLALTSVGDLTLTPSAGNDVVINSHWEFDGNLLTALTDNHTVITAFTGKNITIEGVAFDGNVVTGITNLSMTGDLVINTDKFTVTGATGNTVIAGSLGIGAGATVSAKAHILSTTEQLRIGYDGSNYYSTTVSNAGLVTFNAVGSSAAFLFLDSVIAYNSVQIVIGASSAAPLVAGTNFSVISSATASTNCFQNIQSGSTGIAGLTLGDSNDDDVASIAFDNATNILMLTNAGNTVYLNSSGMIGIGTGSTISARFHAISTGEQVRIGYDASNYYSTTVSNAGTVTFNAVGSGAAFLINNTAQINRGGSIPAALLTATAFSVISSVSPGTHCFLGVQSGAQGVAGITLGDSDVDDVSRVQFDNLTNTLQLINSSTGIYIDSSGNVGFGISSILARAHILATTEQLRVAYNASNYYSTTVSPTGSVTFNAVGSGAAFTFSDNITINGAGQINVGESTPASLASGTSFSVISSASAGTNCYVNIQSGAAGNAGITYGDSADDDLAITYLDNSTNIFHIKVSGNIGISVNPNGYVTNLVQHVLSGTPASYIAPTVASFVNSGLSTTNCCINIQSGEEGFSAITFGNSTDDDPGYIKFDNATNIFSFISTGNYMYFDNVGNLGIGSSTVSARIHATSTTEQLRLGYDASNYYSTTVSSAGAVTFNAVGAIPLFAFSDLVSITSTTEQLRLSYDSSNYISVTVGSDGETTLSATGSGAAFAFSDPVDVTGILSATGGIDAGTSGTALKCKVLPIGVWNMDAISSVGVFHGVTDSKIRIISVLIVNDSSSSLTPLNFADTPSGSGTNGSFSSTLGTLVLLRLTGGYFDNVDYNSVLLDRGFITIWYEA